MSKESLCKKSFEFGEKAYFKDEEECPWKDSDLQCLLVEEQIDSLADQLILYREWTKGFSYARRRLFDANLKSLGMAI